MKVITNMWPTVSYDVEGKRLLASFGGTEIEMTAQEARQFIKYLNSAVKKVEEEDG